jgi:hypothetical protein
MRKRVAEGRLRGRQVPQLGQPGAGKHPANGALGYPEAGGDAPLHEAPAAQLHDRQRLGRADRPGATLGARGTVGQPRLAFGQVAAHPLTRAGHAHVVRGRGRAQRQPSFQNILHQFQSTGEGESGILVGVHSAELLWEVGRFTPPSLSDSVRMNRNNLLGRHS